MDVLRVELAALTASFRYPHFLWGGHPTYDLPPPSTIYGLICSATGERPDPAGLRFGYTFRHAGKATDIEHIHVMEATTAKLNFGDQMLQANVAGNTNPLAREFLFQPRLTLYLRPLFLAASFRRPHHALTLGRSQDLATVSRVEIISLQQAEQAYYEGTLLPDGLHSERGIVASLPRYIDGQRQAEFSQYRMLIGRERAHETATHWVDPDSPDWQGARRGVILHAFVDGAAVGTASEG